MPTLSSGTPLLHRHDRTTLGAYPASSCVTSSATRRGCYGPYFLTEESEAQKGRMTISRPHSWKGAELESTQFCVLSHRDRMFPFSVSGGSSESHSLAPVSRIQQVQANAWPWVWQCRTTFTIGESNEHHWCS